MLIRFKIHRILLAVPGNLVLAVPGNLVRSTPHEKGATRQARTGIKKIGFKIFLSSVKRSRFGNAVRVKNENKSLPTSAGR